MGKTESLFQANQKKESINQRLKKSINIKKEGEFIQNSEPLVEYNLINTKTQLNETRDKRKFNHRPKISVDESFFSVADKQARISSYLKILVQLIDELELVIPKQKSILDDIKWNYNADNTLPKLATSFNGILIQVLEDFISGKSEREQEILLNTLKKRIEREKP